MKLWIRGLPMSRTSQASCFGTVIVDNYVLYNSLSPFCVLFYEFSSWSDDSDEPQVTSQKWERPPFSMFGPTMFYTQCLDLISHRNMGL
jgi:hypothetical protein